MSAEKAKAQLEKYGLGGRVKTFSQSSATVELAAKALGCEPARIAKSITFLVNDKAVMVVAAGDVKIDNAKFKAKFGVKAKMLSAEQAVDMVGHAVGGVCPFGVNEGVEVYLDESLKRFEIIYPACGTANTAVELSVPELEKCSEYREWVDVCKPSEG